jgi:hypothetical protein
LAALTRLQSETAVDAMLPVILNRALKEELS